MSLLKALFDKTLFRHDMKRYRALLITFSILMFVGGPLLLIFMYSVSGEKTAFAFGDPTTVSFFGLASFILGIFSMCAGAITAFVVCSRHTLRGSAYFYNSLPVKRTAMFITDTFAAFATYALCLIIDGLAAWVVLALGSTTSPIVPLAYVGLTVLDGFAAFVILYSIIYLAGQICSSIFSHIVFAQTLIYYPTVLIAVLIAVFATFDKTFGSDFYIQYALKFSPVCGYFENVFGNADASDVLKVDRGYYIPWLIVAAVCLVLSGIIFANRKSESAGEPLSMRWTLYLIRIMYIVPSALGCSMIFYNLSDESILWLLIGFAVGAVLAHMAINAIVFKSVSKLFYGPISFAVICGLALLILFGVKANFFGINNVPARENVTAIELDGVGVLDVGSGMKFKDPANISALCDIFDDVDYYKSYEDDSEFNPDNYDTTWANITYYTKTGLPCSKTYGLMVIKPEDYESIAIIKSSKEYADMVLQSEYGFLLENRKSANVEANMYLKGDAPIEAEKLAECIEKDFAEGNYSQDSVVYGYFEVKWHGKNEMFDSYRAVTVYDSMKNTVSYLQSLGYDFSYDYITESAVKVTFFEDGKELYSFERNEMLFTDNVYMLLGCTEIGKMYDYPLEKSDVMITLSDKTEIYSHATDWETFEYVREQFKDDAEDITAGTASEDIPVD